MKCFILLTPILFLFACNQGATKETAQGEWITGTQAEQIRTIEKQFRGFDNAMVETGYRYQELYWAGQQQNWEYAGYQLEKIKIAFENGLERRPMRAKSAIFFLNNALPEMKESIQAKDTTVFNKAFRVLTINCNNCHVMEKVPYFRIDVPLQHLSPVR